MPSKEPVLLVVLIDTAELRWYVACVGLDGTPAPLICSEPGNLDGYVGESFDEQVSFLRHRLSGVLQRGCDRLWAREKKPCRIVFLTDGPFPQAPPALTERVAAHFVEWMANPPVVFLSRTGDFSHREALPLRRLAGEWDPAHETVFDASVGELLALPSQSEGWEVVPNKPSRADHTPTPPPTSPGSSCLDWSAAMQAVGGDRDLLASVVEATLDEWPQCIDSLKEALQADDAATVHRVGHTLKGSLKLFNATPAANIALLLEETGKTGYLEGAAPMLEALDSQIQKLLPELSRFLSE